MKKLVAAAATALLLGAIAPVVSHAATGGSTAPAPVRRVSTELQASLGSGSTAPLRVLVQATSRHAGIDAVKAAGLRMVTVLKSVDVVVATGTPDAVRSLTKDARVTYVEKDLPLRLYADDTADIATRTAEARADSSPVRQQTTVTTDDRHGNGHGNGGVGQGNGNGNAAGETTTTVSGDAYTGAGHTIAIVDGGIDGTHPMFQRADGTSKVVRNMKIACVLVCSPGADSDSFMVDVPTNDTDTISAGGHGTHVASIAAALPTQYGDRTLEGTAPGADLIGISVGEGLNIFTADVALDWIARNHADPCAGTSATCSPITVVNNSYGPNGGGEFDPQSATVAIQRKLVAAGVVMVWANGNGDETDTSATSGGTGEDNRSNPPAQDPTAGIISVANYDDGNTGTREGSLNSSSSRGDATRPSTWPDVSAPGTNITAACRPYLAICNSTVPPESDPNFGTISGTSMASPHVAGIVALLQEAGDHLVRTGARTAPLSPAEIEHALEDTAHKFQFGAPYWLLPSSLTDNPDASDSFDKGHGLVDTTAALASILGITDPGAPAACTGTGPVVEDPEGDATSFVGVATPLPSEPALDIRTGTVSWDATAQTMTFGITVEDLSTEPPGSVGEVFDYEFSHAGQAYALNIEHSSAKGDSAELQVFATTGRTAVAPATVTVAGNTLTAVVKNSDLGQGDPPNAEPFATGDVLSSFSIVARRDEVNFIPDVDTAMGSCPFTVGGSASSGGGSTTPDPQQWPTTGDDGTPPPPPTTDATIHDGESFDATMTTSEDTSGVPGVDGYECRGFDDPKCFTYRVDVVPAGAGSSLNVWLDPSAESVVLDDWDVHVYGADGTEVGDPLLGVYSANAGPQTATEIIGVTVAVDAPGTYTIVVDPFNVAKDVEMTMHADLTAPSSSPV